MSSGQPEVPGERLAENLAAYDDRLAAGEVKPPEELKEAVDPALLPDWNRLTAFLTLVEKAWPRGGEDLDHQTIPAEGKRAADSVPVSKDAEAQHRFGRFQILRALGQGGFGVVFLAWDPALRRQVALKVPQPETLVTPEARKRFQREAHAAAKLDHPNIVPVHESGSVGTVAYIAATYCPGVTLAEWLARQPRPVPVRDAAALVGTLARAVAHAHERGVLHRDLKPSNILLQRPEPNAQKFEEDDSLAGFEPRITDFSLAWLADGQGPATRSGVPFGSPPYMAPEQAEGKIKAIGPPADVYGLGCILYELLTGSPPFRGESHLDTLRLLIVEDPRPPRRARREVPPELEAIVLKCLEKDPARRDPSAGDLADDLDRFLAGEPTRARPPGRWERIARKVRRHSAALVVLAVVSASVLVLLGGRLWYESRLEGARRLSRQSAATVRARESVNQRHIQYVSDIRYAEQLIRTAQAHAADEILMRHRPGPGEDDLREFTWYHLARRCHTERQTLTGHRGDVYHVEFSPRGDLLASAGKDGMTHIWDTRTWQLVRSIKVSGTEVNVAAFSPDGKDLATVDDEGKLKLWKIATGQCQRETGAHAGEAAIARFTPDGKTIITGGRKDGLARIWDRATGVMLATFPSPYRGLENAVLAPDGSILVTSGDSELVFWDLNRCERAGSVKVGDHGGLQGIAFSRDGTKLATAHEGDHLVRILDVFSRNLLRVYEGHTDGVFPVVFSADDRTIISAGEDATIRFWDVASGSRRGVHQGHNGRIWSLAVSPDGRTIASAGQDGTVKLWDSEPPSDHLKLPIPHSVTIGFSADGQSLSVLEGGPWFVSRWDVRSGRLLERKPVDLIGIVEDAAFSHDGQSLAITTHEGRLTFWNSATGCLQRSFDQSPGRVNHLQFSAEDRYLLQRHEGGKIWLRDLTSGHLIPFPGDVANDAIFTPGGDVIAVRGNGPFFRWDPKTGRSTTGRFKHPKSAYFAADQQFGETLATGDRESQTIRLWSAGNLELQTELEKDGPGPATVAFTPDGKTLAYIAQKNTVKLWDLTTGEEMLTLRQLTGMVRILRFSPDGRALAAVSSNGPGTFGPWEVFLSRSAENEAKPANR